MDVNSY